MRFALPLSLKAHEELHILDEHANSIQREVLQPDKWRYAWGAKDFRAQNYWSTSLYSHLSGMSLYFLRYGLQNV
jgi:hypothetical protein